ncbi:disulfide bond formation protein B, partial [Acidithiobacillus sp. MC6.1]|nr:disulfide bond formation protein B [Acidithiobacillus sp. MC6.1]
AGTAAGIHGNGGRDLAGLGSYPWWNPSGVSGHTAAHPAAQSAATALPWWAMVALVVLWLSSTWTILRLGKTPRAAWLAAIGAILITVGDLRWVPGGTGAEYLLLASGMVLLLTTPLIPSWNPSKCVDKAIRYSLIILPLLALGFAFWLQIAKGWAPCPLCWLERGDLLFMAFAAARNRPLWPLVFSGLGIITVLAQMLEASKAGGMPAHLLAQACSSIGPSCAAAGTKMLWGLPITWWTGGLLIGLGWLAVMHSRKFLAVGRHE